MWAGTQCPLPGTATTVGSILYMLSGANGGYASDAPGLVSFNTSVYDVYNGACERETCGALLTSERSVRERAQHVRDGRYNGHADWDIS